MAPIDTPPEMLLSVVIPAYNEGWRLPETIAELFAFLTSQSYKAEVLVVENGSTDDTAERVLQLAERLPSLRLLRLEPAGKGLAVRAGVLSARGSAIFQCDADLSTPAAEIPRFLQALHEGYDVVVGSREGVGAIRVGEPSYRHVMGRAFNRAVRALAVPTIVDTQCGFKAYSARAAHTLFKLQTIGGFAFDVEILYLARKYGFRIAQLPVEWRFNDDTKVKAVRDTRRMLADIAAIRLRDARGMYSGPALTDQDGEFE